jgi:hypothetical protein
MLSGFKFLEPESVNSPKLVMRFCPTATTEKLPETFRAEKVRCFFSKGKSA